MVAAGVASALLPMGYLFVRWWHYCVRFRSCPMCGLESRSHVIDLPGPDDGAWLGYSAELRCERCEHPWLEGDGQGL